MKEKILLTILSVLLLSAGAIGQPNAWINELHYDNTGTDVGEFVEIVIKNPQNYVLSEFRVFLYNGNNGQVYDSESLDMFTQGTTIGIYTFYYWYPSSIQNGAPDGLALSYDDTLITGQFLSYEGTFTASDGPAIGIVSVDIGVFENGDTPVEYSLQLSGYGSKYSDFVWQFPADHTPNNLNNNQILLVPPINVTGTLIGGFVQLNWISPITLPPIVGKATKDVVYTAANHSQTSRTEREELLGFNIYRDDALIGSVTDTSFTDVEPLIGSHDYYATAVYDVGESGPSNVVTIVITGINETLENSVVVYPNPGNGTFTVILPENAETILSVKDITGKSIYQTNARETTSIQLNNINRGIYLLNIYDLNNKSHLVKKIVIK